MEELSWNVYIIEAENGCLYTGIAKDVEKRFAKHLSKKTGAKFFRSTKPKKLVYVKKCASKSEALKLEAAIKKLKREEKLKLLENQDK